MADAPSDTARTMTPVDAVLLTRGQRRRALAGQMLEFTAILVDPLRSEGGNDGRTAGRVRRALRLASHLVPASLDSHRSIWSRRSMYSALSSDSFASIGSAGSLFSMGSILSVGSTGSILSIGSAGSILSIGSVGSTGAIGGAGQHNLRGLGASATAATTTLVTQGATVAAGVALAAAAIRG